MCSVPCTVYIAIIVSVFILRKFCFQQHYISHSKVCIQVDSRGHLIPQRVTKDASISNEEGCGCVACIVHCCEDLCCEKVHVTSDFQCMLSPSLMNEASIWRFTSSWSYSACFVEKPHHTSHIVTTSHITHSHMLHTLLHITYHAQSLFITHHISHTL